MIKEQLNDLGDNLPLQPYIGLDDYGNIVIDGKFTKLEDLYATVERIEEILYND